MELFQVCFDTMSIELDSDFDRILIGNSLLVLKTPVHFPVLAVCFDQYLLKSLLM